MHSLAEHGMQVAVISWARLQATTIRPLLLLHSIPNGGRRPPKVAKEMKAEGQRPGVPDLNLPVPARGFLGLWVEMKTTKGVVSEDQAWWHTHLRAAGHDVQVCRSIETAMRVLRDHSLAAQTENPSVWLPVRPLSPTTTPDYRNARKRTPLAASRPRSQEGRPAHPR